MGPGLPSMCVRELERPALGLPLARERERDASFKDPGAVRLGTRVETSRRCNDDHVGCMVDGCGVERCGASP